MDNKGETTERPAQMGYLSDAPIDVSDADRFRRERFAHHIADTIALRTDPTSLVVGIYGRWGEGKTTVLNFIERRLGNSETVECVRFNPWLYQGESQLLLSFFETLATAIGRTLKTRKEETGKWLRTLGTALGTVSVGVGLANLSPGTALESLGESLSSVDILEKRNLLEDLLAESGKRILIMIDDIDRLDNNEIATVFKLVKLAADFTHTSYILAFDQDVVTRALAKRYADSEDSGSSFLEKIVQVPLELPRADVAVLQSMTLEAMTRVLTIAQIEMDDTDVSRFSTVFARYLAPHIGTPRMVKRIANAIEFAVPLVAGEVNVADLLLIEALRVLFPKVYKKLPSVKDALLGIAFDHQGNTAVELVRGQLAPLFEGLDAAATMHVQGALRELFPRIERLYSTYHYGREAIPGWRDSQRICAPDYFDRFFAYGIPIGDLADAELREFVDRLNAETEEEVAEALGSLYDKSTPQRVIQKLRALETSFDATSARTLVLALAKRSDMLPDPPMSPMAGIATAFLQAAMHVASLLRQMPQGDGAAVIRSVIESSPSLPFASEVLRWSHILSGKDVADEAKALSESEIADLEVALGERVARDAAVVPLFISMPRYAPTLYYDWVRGADKTVVEQHLVSLCSNNVENGLALVRSFIPSAWDVASGLRVDSQVDRNAYDLVAAIVDPQVLVDVFASAYPSTAVDELPEDPSGLDEEEETALRFVRLHRFVKPQANTPTESDEAPDK
jgi:hypothetical protein